MKMRFIITILLVCLFLTACVGQGIEMCDDFEPIPIAGTWVLEDLSTFVYSDWLTMYIIIGEDNTFFWQAYGNLTGDLAQTSEFEFEVINLVAQSEGMTWKPDEEVSLKYDAETGRLQYTRMVEFDGEEIIFQYDFIRGELP